MKKGVLTYAMIALAIFGLMFTVSCAKKTVQSEPEAAETTPETEPETAPAPEPEATDTQDIQDEQAQREREMEDEQFQNEHIYYEFDSSVLLPEAQNTLSHKAEYMQKYTDVGLVIEGHCDERGTDAYNLALGERRAESARRYLLDLGIDESRIETISYGEERPLDPGNNEEAWAKNRRAQFLLQ